MTTYMSAAKGGSSSARLNEIPSARIKLQYKTISIMPLKTYDEFLQVHTYIHTYIHTYMYIHIYIHTCTYIKTIVTADDISHSHKD